MRRSFILLTAIVCLASAAARAEEPSAEKAPQPTWSLGAGIGWPNASAVIGLGQTNGPGFATNPSGAVANVDAPNSLLSATLFAERRASDRVWLLSRLSAVYGSSTLENDPLYNVGSEPARQTQSWFAGSVAFGFRSVLGTWSRLQASTFVVGGFGLTHVSSEVQFQSSGQTTFTEMKSVSTSGGWMTGLSGGLICDIELLRNLGLRVSTPLLNASYARAKGTLKSDANKVPTTKVSGFSAGVAIAPSVELRVVF
jgi:hypothetical protein